MMIYQNNTHHMTFEKKTIDLSISSTPFAFSGTPELGSRKKQVLFFGKRKRQKKDTVDDWNVLQNHTFWKLRCPLKKGYFIFQPSIFRKCVSFHGYQFVGDFHPEPKTVVGDVKTPRSEIFWSPSYRRWCLPIGVSTLSGFSLGQTACVSFAPCLCRRPRTLGVIVDFGGRRKGRCLFWKLL